jgi:hypothetical protein
MATCTRKREFLRPSRKCLPRCNFTDIHTHLYAPSFGKLGLWGIDELLTYHYLEAEFFRYSATTPGEYRGSPSISRPTQSGELSLSRTHRFPRPRVASSRFSKRSVFLPEPGPPVWRAAPWVKPISARWKPLPRLP